MRQILLLTFLTALLYADTAVQEENIFILKFIALGVILLIIMPFVLRKLRAMKPKFHKRELPPLEQFEVPVNSEIKLKRDETEPEPEEVVIDPLEMELEHLLNEHSVAEENIARVSLMYRKYLEVTMGRAEAMTGSFAFSEVLDEVIKRLNIQLSEENFEVVYDIAADVPSKIIGDEIKFIDILYYLIQNVVINSDTYLIEVKIKRLNFGDDALHLEIHIPNGENNFSEEKLDIFTPFEGGETETDLELFLAKSYANLMHGDVNFNVEESNNSAFVVEVKLYMPNPGELRHYRLPSKSMIEHSVLVVDDHTESALAVKKMFEYFKNEVDVLSSKELFAALEMLDDYDIVVIQERYYAKHLNKKLLSIKEDRNIKAVSLNKNEGFKHSNEETIMLLDAELTKPVTVQKVFDLLVTLYSDK